MDYKPERALGPLSDWTVPQAWFGHFYAVGAGWTALIGPLFLRSASYSSLGSWGQATFLVAILLLEFHLVRRLLETTLLMRYPPGARMHGIAYLFGLSYYLVVPLTVLPEGAVADVYGVLKRPQQLQQPLPAPALVVAALTSLQWAGVGAFFAGNLLQWHSHKLLAGLAPKLEGPGAKPAYKVPYGGGFDLVSCPHYLGEIVIYAGLLLAEGGNRLLMWLMLGWVLSNLLLAGGLTHRWYKKRFKAYPKDRRAILPFVY
ncbi:hypothetical protein N2152v2_009089 [Parachlorella kessleri]